MKLVPTKHSDAAVRLRGRNDVRRERRKRSAAGRDTPVHSYNKQRGVASYREKPLLLYFERP